jgi:sarcosine oxidase subunit alpha
VQAIGFQPATSLLYQSGSKLKFDPQLGHARVKEYADGVGSAGAVNGLQDRDLCAVDGRRAGLDALRNLGRLDSDGVRRLTEFTQQVEQSCGTEQTGGGQFLSSSTAKKKFVCLCEDVTEKDVYDAIDEGYANIETLKRYSTISMGPCQGKMCQASAIALCARHNGRTIEETGTTTSRPPEQPVPLGVLAGRAPTFGLTRRTAMHDWHTLAGATHLDAGAWKRPEHYGDPDQEYEAVRNRAGLVDVSTLGKLELRGPDVAEFLEFVYPNRFQGLKSGRARYGVLCDEAGILLDDGTISRLDEERFLLTTTTGNAAAVDGWFRWWLTCRPELNVSLTNMTSCFAAMNLAGPNSREILSKLTGVDLSNEALPYLSAAEFEVAGVTATVLRLGFVGELGYEIHVPTQFGLHVWESLLDAGQELGIRPFGVEAQRRLRLDKQHLLPGVDTDALSNPLEAGLPWIVKLDKDDFIGRSSLARAQQRGLQQALVGFVLPGREVPHEASLVVRGNRLAGRVTSARYSPVAGAVVGLAWVNADQASNGEQIAIRTDSGTAKAVVQREPFYDPDGLKLKS